MCLTKCSLICSDALIENLSRLNVQGIECYSPNLSAEGGCTKMLADLFSHFNDIFAPSKTKGIYWFSNVTNFDLTFCRRK